jgi:predicted nucleic acid-binding protein
MFVVDANIIISALIKNSITRELINYGFLELISVQFVFEEINKHKEELLKKSGLSILEYEKNLSLIKSKITIFPCEYFKDYLKIAKQISPDVNDIQYFALALKTDSVIWSNDKALKNQKIVKIFSTSEVIKLLENSSL